MRVELLDYSLPEHAIAQRPTPERDGARLLCVDQAGVQHQRLADWVSLVPEAALVVLNDTRVRRSRLLAKKSSGGNVELLFLEARATAPDTQEWIALGHSNRPLRPGARLELGPLQLTVIDREASGQLRLEVKGEHDLEGFFERYGRVPLPPYIRRDPVLDDAERYQTVFAEHLGSAAAPTAGLHVTRSMLERLANRGVQVAFATLHVGAGTFVPVRSDDLDDHPMHAEQYRISQDLCEQVTRARERGAPVVAVGTTVVRALESAHDPERPGHVQPGSGQTRLLIQPGFEFRVVDALLTNFHAPRSTLLALVSAFIGQRRCASAYRVALAEGYRFLSYGDAMWLPRRLEVDVNETPRDERDDSVGI
jgi:S-adenosylmethionine:tRNA ribosyltransferase-isomerase